MPKFALLKGILIVLGLWYLLALIISAPIVPMPHKVFFALAAETFQGQVLRHVGVSLLRIIFGIFFALVLALPIGIAAARLKKANSFISPVLYLLYPVPKIAFLPVLMVFFGMGDTPKIILITIILFFPVAIAVRDGVRNLPSNYFQLAEVLRLSRKQVLKEIILPGILPGIISSLRISIGISLAVLFFSENFATTWGIGYYIMNSWIMGNYVLMYGGIVFLSFTGILLYITLDLLEKKLVPWKI